MQKLFLHIGTGKTATTTIQKTLWNYSLDNEKKSFLYPDFGVPAHHDIVLLVQEYDRLPRGLKQ